MRDVKQAIGVCVFLLAFPAWASDMCELGAVILLPPVYLWVVIAFFVGLWVRKPTTAFVWWVLLGLCAFPALGAALLSMNGALHDSVLKHEGMFNASRLALLALIASYAWAIGRLAMVGKRPLSTPAGSQPL